MFPWSLGPTPSFRLIGVFEGVRLFNYDWDAHGFQAVKLPPLVDDDVQKEV